MEHREVKGGPRCNQESSRVKLMCLETEPPSKGVVYMGSTMFNCQRTQLLCVCFPKLYMHIVVLKKQIVALESSVTCCDPFVEDS